MTDNTKYSRDHGSSNANALVPLGDGAALVTSLSTAATYIDPSGISHEGFHLHPGDAFEVHPAAQRFRRDAQDIQSLTRSLSNVGQQVPAVVHINEHGGIEILDGVTRLQILHANGCPLFCRVIQEGELVGKSVTQWIVEVNFHGTLGRKFSDVQRALQATELMHDFTEDAQKRIKAGKSVVHGFKGRTVEQLATIANCTPNRMRDAAAIFRCDSQQLMNHVWGNNSSMSLAAKIAHIADKQIRERAIAALVSGDLVTLRTILGIVENKGDASRARDRLKRPVPQILQATFNCVPDANKAIQLLTRAHQHLSATGNVFEERTLQALSELTIQISNGIPFCVCLDCDGQGRNVDSETQCHGCAGKGWQSAYEFEHAKAQRLKSLLKKR